MILLDTHVLVWAAVAPDRLSKRAAMAIRRNEARAGLGIASISLWELAFLFSRGRLRRRGTVGESVRRVLEMTRVVIKEITPEIAVLAQELPQGFPADPQDRLISATAMIEGMALVTADEAIARSRLVETIW